MRNALLLFLIGLLAFSLALCGCPKGDTGDGGGAATGAGGGAGGTAKPAEPPADAWVDYVCDDHGFKCQFPKDPYVEGPEVQETAAGKMSSYAYRCEIENGNVAYAVQVIEVSEDMASAISSPDFLKNQKDAIAGGFAGATVNKEEEIDAYGTKVFELELAVPKSETMPADLVYRARMFSVGSRWFQVIATHMTSLDKPDDAAKFFDSFELVTDEGAEGGAEPAESAAESAGAATSESTESPAVGLAEEADES